MGRIVIKPERDRDLYIGWSSIVESPVWWGPRAEALKYLAEEALRGPSDPPSIRLGRADEHGTSDLSVREGGWDDEGLIYEQRGWLPRKHLVAMVEALERDDETAVWDLLEPFDDETPVRRG